MGLVVRIRLVVVHYFPFSDVYYARLVCAGLFFLRVPVSQSFRLGFTGNKP